jgi:hypothetical protein
MRIVSVVSAVLIGCAAEGPELVAECRRTLGGGLEYVAFPEEFLRSPPDAATPTQSEPTFWACDCECDSDGRAWSDTVHRCSLGNLSERIAADLGARRGGECSCECALAVGDCVCDPCTDSQPWPGCG